MELSLIRACHSCGFTLQFLLPLLFSCQKTPCPAVGEVFPPFSETRWINSPPVNLEKLRGKIVLIRWWTDGCIFCVHSADALNEWYDAYHGDGLEVIGMYHPKPRGLRPGPEEVREFAADKGFRFPIGLDTEWENLDRVWLCSGEKPFTSVSFLLDRQGRIAYVHPGGEYHRIEETGHEQCVRDYHLLDSLIRTGLRDTVKF